MKKKQKIIKCIDNIISDLEEKKDFPVFLFERKKYKEYIGKLNYIKNYIENEQDNY